ncbi:MAG: MOSC domain-containing protein [Acidobacteria bacterium]|nr:MAG: MOSC domain-containing protein [Acidobacteriota bacterium]
MRLVSLNIGLPRVLAWKGATFKTGIFKKPVDGRIMLRQTNLDGDRQADLSVHGGIGKAVYAYSSEHYGYWRLKLPEEELPWGAFGENFTTEGLLESGVCMGDEYRVGSAVVRVTTPRLPCFKLAAKFRREDMIKRFLDSGFSGFYFSVMQEGEVGVGDAFEFLTGEVPSLTIADFNHLYTAHDPDLELLKRAVEVKSLPESWRERFQARMEVAVEKHQI